MRTKLKVGDSFEVVEVLSNYWFHLLFKVGGHTVRSSGNVWNNTLANGEEWYFANKKKDLNLNHGLWITDSEVKPIGKLTITKVK